MEARIISSRYYMSHRVLYKRQNSTLQCSRNSLDESCWPTDSMSEEMCVRLTREEQERIAEDNAPLQGYLLSSTTGTEKQREEQTVSDNFWSKRKLQRGERIFFLAPSLNTNACK